MSFACVPRELCTLAPSEKMARLDKLPSLAAERRSAWFLAKHRARHAKEEGHQDGHPFRCPTEKPSSGGVLAGRGNKRQRTSRSSENFCIRMLTV